MDVKGGITVSSTSTIPYRPSLSVRVVYEPDGTPLYCGRDVAEILGYKAPVRAIHRAEGLTIYRRRVSWSSAKECRRLSSDVLCLDKHGCKKLAELRKEGSRDAAQWVMNEMIQKAELDRPPVTEVVTQQEPAVSAPPVGEHWPPVDVRGFEAKLDAIITQCVVMKAQIGSLYGAQYAGQ